MKIAFFISHISTWHIHFTRRLRCNSCRDSFFCEPNDIGIFFINDGVLNLIDNQQPEIIQQKDFIRTFKLLDLYDVEQRFICTASLQKFKLDNRELILSCEKLTALYC